MSSELYIIVGPDGFPIRLVPSAPPLLFPTEQAGTAFRDYKRYDPKIYKVQRRILASPELLNDLRLTIQRLNRRAQKAEGRLIRIARRFPLGWRALLYQDALAEWRKRRKDAAPPPPDLEQYRLALAYAVQAIHNLAGDRLSVGKTSISSALYLKCAADHLADPTSRMIRIHDNPIRGETRPTLPCTTSSPPSLSSVLPASTISS